MAERAAGLALALVVAVSACTGSGGDDASRSSRAAESDAVSTTVGGAVVAAGPCGPALAGSAADATPLQVVAVVPDDGGTSRAPEVAAVRGFAEWCNGHGGIAGRPLAVQVDASRDGHGSMLRACADESVLAVVGSTYPFEEAAAQTATDCALPVVPAVAPGPWLADGTTVVGPVPDPVGTFGIGPARFVAGRAPDAVAAAAVLYDAPYEVVGRRRAEALRGVGWDVQYEGLLAAGGADAASHVAVLAARGVRALAVDAEPAAAVEVLRALAETGLDLPVRLAGPSAADAVVAHVPGADGLLVESVTVPLDDADPPDELRRYAREAGGFGALGAAGARAWSAALLFATAARAAGPEVDRAALLDALLAVGEWDGNGLHVAGAPGPHRASDCWMLLRVEGGAFVREHPASGFACEPDHRFPLVGDHGAGTKPRGP